MPEMCTPRSTPCSRLSDSRRTRRERRCRVIGDAVRVIHRHPTGSGFTVVTMSGDPTRYECGECGAEVEVVLLDAEPVTLAVEREVVESLSQADRSPGL